MMLPTATTALSPALSIMQSIVSDQERGLQPGTPGDDGMPNVAVTPAYDTRSTQKLNDFYFGDHQRASEVQAKIFNALVQYMDKQIGAAENPDAPDTETPHASAALTDSLEEMDGDVRQGLKASLADYTEGRQSIQATATRMLMTLDLDVLSTDRTITRYLEQMVGFDLKGMSAKEILEAFADPGGKESNKLTAIISDALAGEEGSKVRQRLEDATKGLRSAEETQRDIEDVKPYDEVDQETKDEDQDDLKLAKAFDTLTDTRALAEAATEQEADLAKAKIAIERAGAHSGKADATGETPPAGDGATDAVAGAVADDTAKAGAGEARETAGSWVLAAYAQDETRPDAPAATGWTFYL
ncbi:hypothetical protein [Hoeflea olei]|uniref:Uncharacterized protein n=1 Tax=Hoeflea olei TaxID=1480615 RepID=A0A1C1YU81_9HYPH|nr:hypothetical protein [Hoeflea olei]OCW57079.1 hypothetical protein AWJ14_07985 [Hoeflea olei]